MNLLTIKNLTKAYTDKVLFDGIDFSLEEGEKVGIIGINGTGKSTLLRIIAGIEEGDTGEYTKGNHVLINYLPQNPEFAPGQTILEYVIGQNQMHGIAGDTSLSGDYGVEGEAKSILNRLGFTDLNQPIDHLSGGQKKKVALAAVLLSKNEILIMDEPTNHLDHNMTEWLEGWLKSYRGSLIMITHDRYFLDLVCNRIVELDKGKLYYVLAPLNKKESRIYYPVDREKDGRARRTITRAEAEQVLNEIPRIALIEVVNDKMREDIYKQTLYSGDCRNWAALIKTLFLRRQDRLRQGKRIASVDERYMKMAEEALYSEMAFALGKSKEEMKHFIIDYIENRQEMVCG